MAIMAVCKRMGQIRPNSYSRFSRFEIPTISSSTSHPVKSNGNHLFLIDTLALGNCKHFSSFPLQVSFFSNFMQCIILQVRRLEAEGLPSKQAEALTGAMTQVLNDSLENVSVSAVSKPEMQKSEMTQESNLSNLKSEVQSSQELHFSLLQQENEKLRNDIEKMRNELRHEIDKVNVGQRLDLNLERGRLKDELSNQNAGTSSLTNKLDREIHALQAQLEGAKYELIKYCIGTLVSISAAALAVVRLLM